MEFWPSRRFASVLTRREGEVADLITICKTNSEVAEALGITVRTCELHRRRVFAKLGVKTVTHLTWLVLAGTLPPEKCEPGLSIVLADMRPASATGDAMVAPSATAGGVAVLPPKVTTSDPRRHRLSIRGSP